MTAGMQPLRLCITAFGMSALLALYPFTAIAADEQAVARDTVAEIVRSIRHLETMDAAIDEKLAELEAQKAEATASANEARLTLARLYRLAARDAQIPRAFLYFNGGALHTAYYRDRERIGIAAYLSDSMDRAGAQIAASERIIADIAMYKDERTTIRQTAEAYFARLDEKRGAQTSLPENINQAINDLKERHATLDAFVRSLIDMNAMTAAPVPPAPAMRGFTLPVSGIVYPDPAVSNAIRIESGSGNLVTAPAPGTVLFAGPFRTLGTIVIVDHGDGHVSVLRGMDTVYVAQGQTIQQDDPLGRLPALDLETQKKQKDGVNRSMLYYELRYNNVIINPVEKLSESS